MRKKSSLLLICSLLFCVGFLVSCGNRQIEHGEKLMSIQILDRNGFKETINAPDRLALYEKADFFKPQPYTKVVRIYTCNKEGKNPSRITTYHENGQLWQYLDVINGRACGVYREWHANGQLHLKVGVIEGLAILSEAAQREWIFDGISHAWDEQGHLLAQINYEKGKLQGHAMHYYPNGQVSKFIPYQNNQIDGVLILYDEEGTVVGQTPFRQGKREGKATFKGDTQCPPYTEEYKNDLLIEGVYCDFLGNQIGKIENGRGEKPLFQEGKLHSTQEFRSGAKEGKVQLFDDQGFLSSYFEVKGELKHGEEWIYFPQKKGEPLQPKLYLEWYEDMVHGICRSWYSNGVLESEREMYENKKQGLSSAWYSDRSLMFVEEYQKSTLLSGTYMKRGDPSPISTIKNGKGRATLYDEKGRFIRQIEYTKGQAISEQ